MAHSEGLDSKVVVTCFYMSALSRIPHDITMRKRSSPSYCRVHLTREPSHLSVCELCCHAKTAALAFGSSFRMQIAGRFIHVSHAALRQRMARPVPLNAATLHEPIPHATDPTTVYNVVTKKTLTVYTFLRKVYTVRETSRSKVYTVPEARLKVYTVVTISDTKVYTVSRDRMWHSHHHFA